MGVLDNRGNLSGRKALVIGGAGGIGKAVTLLLWRKPKSMWRSATSMLNLCNRRSMKYQRSYVSRSDTNFSKAMARELGPDRTRVNVIAPDTTPSEGNVKAVPAHLQRENAAVPAEWWSSAMAIYIPLGVPPSQDDLANTVVFLVSDLAMSITGHVIHVDGGTAAAVGMLRWPFDGGSKLPLPFAPTLTKLFGS